MKFKMIAVFVLLTSGFAFGAADQTSKGLPILDGRVADVVAVRLVQAEVVMPPGAQPPYHGSLMATISYIGGCEAPVSFVVVRQGSSMNFQIIENYDRVVINRARCLSITEVTKEILVSQFSESPDLPKITVNGVGMTP